jgi:hypothetical protein
MKEGKETRELCALLVKCNAMVFVTNVTVYGTDGWPDRYIAHRYWSGWVEFKVGRNQLSDKQREVLDGLRQRGVQACCIRITEAELVVDETQTYPRPRTPRDAALWLQWMDTIL